MTSSIVNKKTPPRYNTKRTHKTIGLSGFGNTDRTKVTQIYWSDFRKRVLKRDKYKCQKCFKNKDLVIHHITPVSEGGKKFDMCNCITLCKKCEKKEHRINKPQTFLESILDNSEIIPEGSD